jgi:hypothetical protein
MNQVTLAIGVFAIGFGAYTAWARVKRPETLKKLEPMKNHWGEKAGVAIHFVAYTVVPVFFGIVTVINGLNGGSLLNGLAKGRPTSCRGGRCSVSLANLRSGGCRARVGMLATCRCYGPVLNR